MTTSRTLLCWELRSRALTLRREYEHLLRPEPSFRRPDADEAWDRLEAARQRAVQPHRETRQLQLEVD